MNELVKSFENLPLVVKLILALPALDIIWVIYRIIKSASEQNALGLIIGIALIIIGLPFLWIIDMVFIIWKGNVWWF